MATPSQRPLGTGKRHFTPDLRANACQQFYLAYLELHGKRLDDQDLPELDRGPEGDRAVTMAYQRFMDANSRDGLLIGLGRDCDREAYVELLRRSFKQYSVTRTCPTKSRKKDVNLTHQEAEQLFKLLTTPQWHKGNPIRFAGLDDAAKKDADIKHLCKKSGATMTYLHRWMMGKFPNLQYEPEDRVQELVASTLKSRRECAAIWRGEQPWFQRPPTVATRAAGGSDSHADADALHDVYFDPKWMKQHTFMLDATTFSNREGPVHSTAPRVYTDKHEVYGPNPVDADKSIAGSIQIMVYIVIHAYLGLVLGPCIMFTGSKLPMSVRDKAWMFDYYGIHTW